MVQRVERKGWPLAAMAEAAGVPRETAYRWLRRWSAEGAVVAIIRDAQGLEPDEYLVTTDATATPWLPSGEKSGLGLFLTSHPTSAQPQKFHRPSRRSGRGRLTAMWKAKSPLFQALVGQPRPLDRGGRPSVTPQWAPLGTDCRAAAARIGWPPSTRPSDSTVRPAPASGAGRVDPW